VTNPPTTKVHSARKKYCLVIASSPAFSQSTYCAKRLETAQLRERTLVRLMVFLLSAELIRWRKSVSGKELKLPRERGRCPLWTEADQLTRIFVRSRETARINGNQHSASNQRSTIRNHQLINNQKSTTIKLSESLP
jgi:hypothetical protein